MIIFVVGVLLMLYGFIKNKTYSVYVGMCFVLLIMGFQEGVQGDFMGYKHSFTYGLDSSYTLKETEFSYISLVNFFQFTSFHVYVFFHSLAQCLILAYALKTYVTKRFQNFGWLVFFFTTGCMLIQMKAMRQGYAIETVLLAFILLDKNKIILSLVTLVIGWGFHNSAMVFIPLYLILLINKLGLLSRINFQTIIHSRLFPMSVALGCIVIYILKSTLIDVYILPYLMTLEFAYEGYAEALVATSISWWIICFFSLFAYAIGCYIKEEHDSTKQIIAIGTLIDIYGSIMVWGLGNLQRVFHYYTIYGVLCYPLVADFLRTKYGKNVSIIFMFLYLVFAFMFSSRWLFSSVDDMFATYKFSFLE